MTAPRYLKQVAGVPTEQAAAETSAAEAIVATLPSGLLDVSLMPVGIGPATRTIVASEALAAGDLVNVWVNAGAANARKADASAAGKEAHGYVLAGVSPSADATVYFDDLNTGQSGLTLGVQYLSATTAGKATSSAPSAAGQVIQRVGIADTATSLMFQAMLPVVLA